MAPSDAPQLLHIVGYLTGASLYGMLLVMAIRASGPAHRLTLGTAVLGLAWNTGELAAHVFEGLGLMGARDWMAAVSYGALGFLAAVAVHSAVGAPDLKTDLGSARARALAAAGYACAAAAAALQLLAAALGYPLPWPPALLLLTVGLGILTPPLFLSTQRQPHGRRALWIIALALFAVSALHLGQFHGAPEGWVVELLGHHASIPLAFAILYQNYRFAFADLFLKRALALLVLVTLVFLGWALVAPSIGRDTESPAVGLLLAMWVATTLAYPWMRHRISGLVDRVFLQRADYSSLLDRLATDVEECASEEAVLAITCEHVGPALSADSVRWRQASGQNIVGADRVVVPTAEAPVNVIEIGSLRGGRQILSDDVMMLERAARLAGRRIDALRLKDERYERMLREREIATLATEAELRALRAQINPHFLFNALTTIGYLIQSAPSRAVDTLLRLTTLLRAVLRSEGEFTTLGHEEALVTCYLQIEQERFEERLEAIVQVPPSLTDVRIPSLIVQPLVENAIKHGIAQAREGGHVRVSAHLQRDQTGPLLLIEVRNSGAPLEGVAAREGGIGLQNVERRLRCCYGDRATLTLGRDATGETVAELRLPVTEATLRLQSEPVEQTVP